MKTKMLILAICFFSHLCREVLPFLEDSGWAVCSAQPSFILAKQMGGTSKDYGTSIAVDGSGNVYTTGVFAGTADFDPGSGTFNLTSAGSYDIFISKLDASGNFLW